MNRCIFQGRIVKEPTIRNIDNGGIVYSNSLAVNRAYKKEEESECDFINIVAFGKTAEFMQKYMSTKGQQILVETHLQNRNWDDDKGVKHYATDFVVERCYFADSKKENNTETELKNTFGETLTVQENDLPF